MKTGKQLIIRSAFVMIALGALSACDDNDNNTEILTDPRLQAPSPDLTNIYQIDATSGGLGVATNSLANKYTYFNLETGAVVELNDATAATSNDWHIAFKRTRTKINGGVSGPGSVTGALADSQADFYTAEGEPDTSVFLNSSTDAEQTAFDTITDINGLNFVSDRHIAAIVGDGGNESWWSYNPALHSVEAAPDNWWLVKSAAENSYAKLHVTYIEQTNREISFELFIQADGESVFSSTATNYTAIIGSAGGSKCYDIDSRSEIDCSTASNDWDLKVEVSSDGRSWNIWSNGGIYGDGKGGVFWGVDAADADNYVSGTTTSSGFNFSAHYKPDTTGGLFVDNNWYEYSLEGRHKLWPNYRVYAIDTGTGQYKLQILSFYDDADTSGMIKFRYESL